MIQTLTDSVPFTAFVVVALVQAIRKAAPWFDGAKVLGLAAVVSIVWTLVSMRPSGMSGWFDAAMVSTVVWGVAIGSDALAKKYLVGA